MGAAPRLLDIDTSGGQTSWGISGGTPTGTRFCRCRGRIAAGRCSSHRWMLWHGGRTSRPSRERRPGPAITMNLGQLPARHMLFMLTVALAAPPPPATPAPAVPTLTIERAMELAMERNEESRMADERAVAAQARLER